MSTQGIKRSRYSGSSARAWHPDPPWWRVASNVSCSAAVAVASLTVLRELGNPDLRNGSPIGTCWARNAPGPWFQNCRVKPRGCSTSSARRFVARGDFDRLFDSISSNGSPLTSRTSIGPPGLQSSKTAIASRPVYHANVSRLVRFFLKIGPCAC